MSRTFRSVSLLVVASAALFAQAEKRPSFEVATVKLAPPNTGSAFQNGYRMGMATRGIVVAGKRVTVTYQTLRDLVRVSYQAKDYQVSAAPWMVSQHFDVVASLPEGADGSQAPPMLRTLLEERFHLECHWETKEMQVLALVVGKGGFRPSNVAGGDTWTMVAGPGPRAGASSGVRSIRMKAASMAALADRLNNFTDHPVVDMTELGGNYDFDVTFGVGDNDAAPSLFTVLQEQLGLKLEARKGPIKIVVVDRADKLPTEN